MKRNIINNRMHDDGKRAFSLIEVALALGLMTFCIGALIGLISIGLTLQQNASEQSRAVRALDALSACIRQAGPDSDGICHVNLPSSEGLGFDFAPGGDAITWMFGVTEAGTFCKADAPKRRGTIRIELNPPPTAIESGYALLSVGWTGAATYDRRGWSQQLGSVETVVFFTLQ